MLQRFLKGDLVEQFDVFLAPVKLRLVCCDLEIKLPIEFCFLAFVGFCELGFDGGFVFVEFALCHLFYLL